ncbi:MAG: hypothetical protein C0179_02525 [Fervidicoccus sp.]|nr:MAG: hypothetical protein C0179_02525 [Fervidicoccus sp.]
MSENNGVVWDGKRWLSREELLEMLGKEYGEDIEDISEDMVKYFDCDSDIERVMDLDGNCIDSVLSDFMEEMRYYSDHITLITPHKYKGKKYHVKIKGYKLDNTVLWFLGENDIVVDAFEDLMEKGVIKSILDLLKTGYWYRVDPWRGHSEYGSSNEWIKVVDGWIGWVSKPGELFKVLHDIFELEKLVDFPILFISAHSSNIFVRYLYVYVRAEDLERFKEVVPRATHEDMYNPDYCLISYY